MVLRSKGCRDVVGSLGSRGSSLRAGSTVWMGVAAERNQVRVTDEKNGDQRELQVRRGSQQA